MQMITNDTILALIQAEIDYQYHEMYSTQIDHFTARWRHYFARTKNTEKEIPDDSFLIGLSRMLGYLDVDKKLLDLYILLTHATYDARKPFQPIWGISTFSVSRSRIALNPIEMKFVVVREAILSEDVYRQFTETLEPFGFKAILLGSGILLPESNLIGCVWAHPEGSKQGYLVSDVDGIRYITPYLVTLWE